MKIYKNEMKLEIQINFLWARKLFVSSVVAAAAECISTLTSQRILIVGEMVNNANCQIQCRISQSGSKIVCCYIYFIENIRRMLSQANNTMLELAFASTFPLRPVDILKSAKYTDITLICGASKIRAHKIMLSACSPYFDEFFMRDRKCTEIVLDLHFEDLLCIVLYIYQGKIVIPVERKAALIRTARLFGVAIEEENIHSVSNRMEFLKGRAL